MIDKAKAQTISTVSEFVAGLLSENYGSAADVVTTTAIAVAGVASAAMNKYPQLTSIDLWHIFTHAISLFRYDKLKCGYKLIDLEMALYPNMEGVFNSIEERNWKSMQEDAERKLAATCSEELKKHLQDIVDGKVPYGFEIVPDCRLDRY